LGVVEDEGHDHERNSDEQDDQTYDHQKRKSLRCAV
jgi:hypothetical protein